MEIHADNYRRVIPRAHSGNDFLSLLKTYDVVGIIEKTRPDLKLLNDSPMPKHVLNELLRDKFRGRLNQENMLKCLERLIECGCEVNSLDSDGETPLSLAVQNGFESCAKLLLQNGADTSMITRKYKKNYSLAIAIGENMPDLMIEVFNLGIHCDNEYLYLDLSRVIKNPKKGRSEQGITNEHEREEEYKKGFKRESSFLYSLIETLDDNDSEKQTLYKYLTHPLVEAYIELKQNVVSSKLLWFQFILMLYPILYMSFIYFLYFVYCKFDQPEDGDTEEQSSSRIQTIDQTSESSTPIQQRCRITYLLVISAYLLAIVIIAFVCVEVYLIYKVNVKIMKRWRFWIIQLTLLIMALTLWPALQIKESYNISWQYSIAAFGTFFACVMFLLQMEVIPHVRTHIEMLISVIFNVVKTTIIFSPLFLGFYMGFSLMFFDMANIITFILMAVDAGSDEFAEMSQTSKDGRLWFTTMSYMFTVGFIVVIAIVFINLLLGISINDIQELRLCGETMEISNKIQNFLAIEIILKNHTRVINIDNGNDDCNNFVIKFRQSSDINVKDAFSANQKNLTRPWNGARELTSKNMSETITDKLVDWFISTNKRVASNEEYKFSTWC